MAGWLSRLLRSQEEQEADELGEQARALGAAPIGACQRGQQVTVCGTVRSVSLRPRAAAPAVEAEIYDGSGHITLVWLGRRRIPGIDVGRMLVARGRLTCPGEQPMIFNPEYELRPRGDRAAQAVT